MSSTPAPRLTPNGAGWRTKRTSTSGMKRNRITPVARIRKRLGAAPSVLLIRLQSQADHQVLQDARGEAPDPPVADVVDAQAVRYAVEEHVLLLHQFRIGKGGEREAEDLGDLGGVQLHLVGKRDRSHARDHPEAGGAFELVELAQAKHPLGIDADLFLRLAQRGRPGVLLELLAAAGEGDLAAVA